MAMILAINNTYENNQIDKSDQPRCAGPRCVPTQTEVREQERAKLDRQLGDYLKRGEYIVRVEI